VAELSENRALLDVVEVIQNNRRRCFQASFGLPIACRAAMMLPLESISGQSKPKVVILPAIARNLGVRVTRVILGVGDELNELPMLDAPGPRL